MSSSHGDKLITDRAQCFSIYYDRSFVNICHSIYLAYNLSSCCVLVPDNVRLADVVLRRQLVVFESLRYVQGPRYCLSIIRKPHISRYLRDDAA